MRNDIVRKAILVLIEVLFDAEKTLIRRLSTSNVTTDRFTPVLENFLKTANNGHFSPPKMKSIIEPELSLNV